MRLAGLGCAIITGVSMKGRPSTYREQKSCRICSHVFKKREYEEGDAFFCMRDGVERPMCGSVLMKEHFVFIEDKSARRSAYDLWEEWAMEREVSAWGICDEYHEEIE